MSLSSSYFDKQNNDKPNGQRKHITKDSKIFDFRFYHKTSHFLGHISQQVCNDGKQCQSKST